MEKVQRCLAVFGVILLLAVISLSSSAQKGSLVRKVVIDAGHGGHDPGTVGKNSREKDLTLGIALRLGKLIGEKAPGVEVVYTRKTDVFVELYRRSQIANNAKADLFISIHCNSAAPNPEPRGVESWVMGLHKSRENLEVARKENASILMEDNYKQYDGFDPNSPEATVIFSLYQNVYLDQSLDMAGRVQQETRERLKLPDRGVKQAGFWVLYKTAMPGLLVEAGFLSNPEDERYLLTEQGQENIASAIFCALNAYRDPGGSFKQVCEQISYTEPVAREKNLKDDTANNNVVSANDPDPLKSNAAGPGTLVFRVQFLSSPKKISSGSAQFRGVKDYEYYIQDGAFKYVTGKCSTLGEAVELQKKIQKNGFRDAFVVAFYNNNRITLAEAKKIAAN